MKKSMVTKIAALGAIGVMTLAGASSALASDFGTNVCSITNQYMSEADAHNIMNQAESNGEVLNKTDDSVTVQDGNYVYEYTFFKTDEKTVNDGYYYTKSAVINRANDQSLYYHDPVIEDDIDTDGWFDFFWIRATIYKGNLRTICENIDNSKHIDIDNDEAMIHPGDEIELTYNVSEGMNRDDVVFVSDKPDVVSVEKENGHVYATGHDTGTATIFATVTNADNSETTASIHIHVLN